MVWAAELGEAAGEDLWLRGGFPLSYLAESSEESLRWREDFVRTFLELDLFLLHRGRRVGVEFKFADAPSLSRQLRTTISDLKLERLWIVYPGERRYPLEDDVDVLPLADMPAVLPSYLG